MRTRPTSRRAASGPRGSSKEGAARSCFAASTGNRAEFETIILFDSLENVRAFAGGELEAAVFFPEDDRYLVERDVTVRHYEVDVHIV